MRSQGILARVGTGGYFLGDYHRKLGEKRAIEFLQTPGLKNQSTINKEQPSVDLLR